MEGVDCCAEASTKKEKVSESPRNWETRNQKVSQWKQISNKKWGRREAVEMASDSDWYIEIASPICKVLKRKKGPGQDESFGVEILYKCIAMLLSILI